MVMFKRLLLTNLLLISSLINLGIKVTHLIRRLQLIVYHKQRCMIRIKLYLAQQFSLILIVQLKS